MTASRLIDETTELVRSVPAERLEVLGEGGLADELRRRIQPGSRARGWQAALHRRKRPTRPLAVIDTTGHAETLAGALARVADRGIVVLAGGRTSRPLPLNLYKDVHVRGVRIIGVGSELD